ncbi:MAG: tRNA 2-thiouridine(34) synthase MnmA [Treponema sp.]|nr:tRNA 2-thiouridine(34) synthase MnmA [Treponema sp.]
MPDKEINTRAICAMSGGVDSSVAAALMLEQDYQCTGVTLKLYKDGSVQSSSGCCSLADVNDARNIAFSLGMDHYVLNFTDEFDKYVIRHFIETYEAGATPNPCIECNRHIKFNLLLLRACQLDFDLLVTGHYARITRDSSSGRYLLRKALDEKKDQSYVLYCLTQQQLQKSCFPLGSLTKNEVRKIAEAKNFVNASKNESQDICFVPDGDYGNFIEGYTGKTYPCGDIVDLDGNVMGRHKGLIRYTIGQRRGLGVAANTPVYVAAKSTAANTVTLASEDALYSKSLTADNINLISCADLKKPLRVMVKTRYLQSAQSAVAEQTGEDILHIEFDSPQRAVTPGQAAVMYDGDIVVGGGTIL